MSSPRVPPLLFHWAPSDRRRAIERLGLMPGKRPVTNAFRAPYVSLATDPLWAWTLSGSVTGHRGMAWDLWAVSVGAVEGRRVERRRDLPQEWRVYGRIYKRGVRYVATRTIERVGPI